MNFRENPQWRIPKRGRRGQRPETPLLYFFCPFCMFPISFFGCLILTFSMSLTSIFSGSEIGLTKICLLATTETLMQIRWDTLKQSFKSNHLLNQSPDSTSESWFHNCVYLPFHETRWNCLFNLGWFFWVTAIALMVSDSVNVFVITNDVCCSEGALSVSLYQ